MIEDDPTGDVFRRALEEARRRAPLPPREDRCELMSGSGLGLCFDFAATRGGGGEARWDLAMEWADEPQAPRAPPAHRRAVDPPSEPAGVADAVAQELGFCAELTAEALTARWRAFVWRNHPDRQPVQARERANARVAVANALYDRARRALRGA